MALLPSGFDEDDQSGKQSRENSTWTLVKEDWVAHGKDWRNPGFRALAVHRFGEWVYGLQSKPAQAVLRKIYGFLFRYVRAHYNIEIMRGAKIGRNVIIAHFFGVVIGPGCEIGDDCLIRHNVTIGGASDDQWKLQPKIEKGVHFGAGAQVLGNVTVGEGTRIGSNVVVTTDIPAHAIVFVDKPKIIQLPTAMLRARAGIRESDRLLLPGRNSADS